MELLVRHLASSEFFVIIKKRLHLAHQFCIIYALCSAIMPTFALLKD